MLKDWWRATRYHFIPPSIFPVTIGSIVYWKNNQSISLEYYFIVLLAVVINHIALNMTDDYFDYLHAVDQQGKVDEKPYSGGSKTLTDGSITPKNMKYMFLFLYGIVIIFGVYLFLEIGIPILIFGLIGVFSSIFYTAPPIKFSHYGFGELGLLINFGTVLGLGSYYVHAQNLSLEAFFATLPCGIMLFSMIIINEIPDVIEDTQAGKMTLVARYGKEFGVNIYIFSWFITYLIIIIGIIFSILPIFSIISFLPLPLVLQSISILKNNYQNPIDMAPANLKMIQAHALLSILIIGSYAITGIINDGLLVDLIGIVLILAIFYIPATLPLITKKS